MGQQSQYKRLGNYYQNKVDSLNLSGVSPAGLKELLGQHRAMSADISNTAKGKDQEVQRLELMAQARFLFGSIARVAEEVNSRESLDKETRQSLLVSIVRTKTTVFNNIKAYSQSLTQISWDV